MEITATAPSVAEALKSLANNVNLDPEQEWRIGTHFESYWDSQAWPQQRVFRVTMWAEQVD